MLFLSLEGLDGVGKSTISKLLAKDLGGLAVRTPQPQLDQARIFIDQSQNPFVRFHFYTSSLYLLNEYLSTQHNNIVVCDRFLHSTLAYSWPFPYDIPDNIQKIFPQLRIPDYTFYLHAAKSVRLQRINKRYLSGTPPSPGDINIAQQNQAELRYNALSGMIQIDTTALSPEQIVIKIKQALL